MPSQPTTGGEPREEGSWKIYKAPAQTWPVELPTGKLATNDGGYVEGPDTEQEWIRVIPAQTLSETLEELADRFDARAEMQLGTSLEPPPGDTTVAELESIGKRKAFREAAQLLRDRAKGAGEKRTESRSARMEAALEDRTSPSPWRGGRDET